MSRISVGNIIWKGPQVTATVEKILEDRLDQSAEFLKTKIVRALMRHGQPPSLPGQIPHYDTTKLYKSVFWKRQSRLVRRVGVPAIQVPGRGLVSYGLFLELGTRKMAKRPYLRPTFEKQWPNIRRIITARIAR